MEYPIKFNNKGKVFRLEAKQDLPISLKEAWDFFSNPKNLVKITPDSLGFEILSDLDSNIYPSQIIQYRVTPLPFFKTTWVTEITHMEDYHFFADKQLYGPYQLWHHKHFFKEIEGGVQIIDIVDYVPPFGILGRIINPIIIKPRILKIFDFRKREVVKMFPSK
jgi:ligand-binding SRPBCC domain-containing protein